MKIELKHIKIADLINGYQDLLVLGCISPLFNIN